MDCNNATEDANELHNSKDQARAARRASVFVAQDSPTCSLAGSLRYQSAEQVATGTLIAVASSQWLVQLSLQIRREHFMKRHPFIVLARVLLMLLAVAGVSLISIVPAGAQSSTVSKSCGKCGRQVPVTSQVGGSCPHCSVRWGFESSTTIPGILGLWTVPRGSTTAELYAKKMARVWKETDQRTLARLAVEDNDSDVRRGAARRLSDQTLIRKVAVESKDTVAREIAVWKLGDRICLQSLSKNDPDAAIRQASMNRLAVETRAIDLGAGVTMDLALVPAGSFRMGVGDEKRGVTLSKPFYMGRYEVTQAQWQTVMGNDPSNNKGGQNPVENVSWNDCQQFLAKLNERLPGMKASLPTEAQWEYACRAGSTREFCYGDGKDRLAEYAWFDSNSDRVTHPVGEKRPNAWGLYDMHGNVSEWCRDWYGSHLASTRRDPQGPDSGKSRVVRGGSFHDPYYDHCCAKRSSHYPDSCYGSMGFRVVFVAGGFSP